MQAITAMSHSLGLKVVVEGVETREHQQIAQGMQCDIAQGYYYSRPLPADEVRKFLNH